MAKEKALPAGFTRRKDGRLQLRFTVGDKRCCVCGHSVKECKEKETKRRKEIEDGLELRNRPTVDQYIESWLDNRRLHLKESTYRGQRQILGVITDIWIPTASKKLGDMKLADVSPDDAKLIQKELLVKRRTQTVNDYMALLQHVFRDAVKERKIPFCPTDTITTLKRTEEKARDNIHRALSLEEQRTFFDCQRTQESSYYNVYRFAVCTGLRLGEIGALSYADIRNGVITVRKTITRTETGAYRVGETTKTDAGRREIPIKQKIAEILDDQKEKNLAMYGNVIGMNDLIFKAPQGGLLMATPADREIKRICKTLGIEPFTMHAFRATFATRAIESGMNPKTLQSLLGHSSFNITMSLYGHCLPNTKADEMEKMEFVC